MCKFTLNVKLHLRAIIKAKQWNINGISFKHYFKQFSKCNTDKRNTMNKVIPEVESKLLHVLYMNHLCIYAPCERPRAWNIHSVALFRSRESYFHAAAQFNIAGFTRVTKRVRGVCGDGFKGVTQWFMVTRSITTREGILIFLYAHSSTRITRVFIISALYIHTYSTMRTCGCYYT